MRPVTLSGDSRATAERVAREVGIDDVIAEALAAEVAELQAAGRKVVTVGDGVNDAPPLAQADVVLMRSDLLDVATTITISRGTLRKMRQNLAWAIGYNSLALPLGLVLRPEVGAISMSGSTIIVALNAISLERLRLPRDHA